MTPKVQGLDGSTGIQDFVLMSLELIFVGVTL